jgi:hypothetical protein
MRSVTIASIAFTSRHEELKRVKKTVQPVVGECMFQVKL